jgi:hypothetical protein
MTYAYRVCGLGVLSDIILPGAIETSDDGAAPQARVRLAPVCEQLDDAIDEGPNWRMAPDGFLLRVPKVARFLVKGGNLIDIELAPEGTASDAAAFVLGTAFGVLLHQRGALALHGAAVAKGGAAIAICGPAAVGKSTLAAALCRAGFDFVADDLCVVALDAEKRPVVEPDGRQLRLWRDSTDKLELGASRAAPLRGGFEKYLVEPPAIAPTCPRLAALYVLHDSRPPLLDGIEPVATADAMRLLDIWAYHPRLRAKLASKPTLMAQGAAMLRHTKVFHLVRPRGFEHMTCTVASLSEHAEQVAR